MTYFLPASTHDLPAYNYGLAATPRDCTRSSTSLPFTSVSCPVCYVSPGPSSYRAPMTVPARQPLGFNWWLGGQGYPMARLQGGALPGAIPNGIVICSSNIGGYWDLTFQWLVKENNQGFVVRKLLSSSNEFSNYEVQRRISWLISWLTMADSKKWLITLTSHNRWR